MINFSLNHVKLFFTIFYEFTSLQRWQNFWSEMKNIWNISLISDDKHSCDQMTVLNSVLKFEYSQLLVLGVELIMVSCVTGAHWSLVSSYTWPRSEQRWETQHCTQHCHGWTIRDDKWIVGSSVHWSCSDQQTWSYWTNKSWDNWSDLLTLILTNSTHHHHGQLDHKT